MFKRKNATRKIMKITFHEHKLLFFQNNNTQLIEKCKEEALTREKTKQEYSTKTLYFTFYR
jgi:hypothetical protein